MEFKDDVDFLGEGFGEYSLCVSLQAPAGAVVVEVNLFAPFIGMVDPRTVADVEESKDAVAVAEDVALAEAAVRRLRADLRVRSRAAHAVLMPAMLTHTYSRACYLFIAAHHVRPGVPEEAPGKPSREHPSGGRGSLAPIWVRSHADVAPAAWQLRHEKTLASSDRRAVVWSTIECAVLAGLSGLQMILFRRAFRNY